ncbi:hypothetical protein BGZ83_007566 [Gryganskiella cystojenkinii]|nr:hypothetical protein BGZ83_007566 [Gryganskiella cystojenkinii]
MRPSTPPASDTIPEIIELQIENANLQGEKESLNRLLSRRDKTLLEVQIQLQAMEFFCRENNIKMDIDVCPDEAIENWCFKESDKVYERILITAQDLLRNGSRCLIGEPVMTRSSSQQLRSTRSSTMTSYSTAMDRASMSSSGFRGHNVVAGLSENVQPLAVQDQEVDPLLFKETSRPGTLKFDLQTLLRSEQEFNSNQQQRPSSTLSSKRDMDQLIAQLDVASNAEPDRGGRRALDGDDDREKFFRAYRESDQFRLSKEVEVHSAGDGNEDIHDVDDDDAYDDDDEEGQDSEFEELGEDMIKFVELQSSVAPRRDSRSMSFSSRMSNPLQPSNAKPTASSPDLSTAVLVKNLWSSGGARRNSSAAMTPMRQNSQPGTFLSSLSQSSLPTSLASVLPPPQAPLPPPPSPPSSGTPVGLGLGFMSMGRSTAGPLPLEKFMSVAPTGAPPMPH